MKINKLLFGGALLPITLIPTALSSSCSNLNGVKSISTKFEIKQSVTTQYTTNPHYGVFTANIVFSQNIKKIDVKGSYIISGASTLITFTLPDTKESTKVEGNIVATTIDDSVFTISYSYFATISNEWLEYTSGGSGYNHYYVSNVSNIEFKDPTKL